MQAALSAGRPVLPVHVLDDDSPGRWRLGGAARWWLHHSLASLDTDLRARGSALVLRRGRAAEVIPAIVAEVGAAEVLTGGSAEPWARATDREVAARIGPVPLRRLRTMMLFSPGRILTRAGTPFLVYSAFARACHDAGAPPPPAPAPDRFPPAPAVASERLDDWRLLPTHPDWAGGLRAAWQPGEAGAQIALSRFAADKAAAYADRRDLMGCDGTSRLSPHLRFGEIAPERVWHEIRATPPGRGAETFIRELLWREFAIHLLWHHPDLLEAPLRAEFAAMPWRDDPGALRAWQRGMTGVPVVDAGMRQLWQTGWMHNRARMVVASFLVKHLLIPWQTGEAWFWDTLVDADLANNAAGWQWVAGSGADAAPYFRVFNPVLQGRKFDPDGAYVRAFVPELRRLDTLHLHAPWEAPAPVLDRAGIRLGRDYPAPIVDLAAGRDRALAAYAALRGKR